MAIQPIDLQTLFVRLSQIGREQSALRDAVAQNQAVVGGEIAQRSQEDARSVRHTEDVSEGPETLDNDSSSQNEQAGSGREEEESEEEWKEDDFFRDPDLGRNIDLSG